jgi:hypothetical protein
MEMKNGLMMILIAFIFISLGFAFFGVVTDSVGSMTQFQTSTNESFTGLRSPATATLSHPNITSVTNVKNSTGITMPTTNYTLNTTTGVISINAPQVNNTAFTATYLYKTANYIDDGASNSITSLISLMVAIGILLGVIAFIYPAIKDTLEF